MNFKMPIDQAQPPKEAAVLIDDVQTYELALSPRPATLTPHGELKKPQSLRR
jgi:hypothetical protein